jgi:hypothetical protein
MANVTHEKVRNENCAFLAYIFKGKSITIVQAVEQWHLIAEVRV